MANTVGLLGNFCGWPWCISGDCVNSALGRIFECRNGRLCCVWARVVFPLGAKTGASQRHTSGRRHSVLDIWGPASVQHQAKQRTMEVHWCSALIIVECQGGTLQKYFRHIYSRPLRWKIICLSNCCFMFVWLVCGFYTSSL